MAIWSVLSITIVLSLNHVLGLRFPAIGDWGDDVASGIVMQKRVADVLANYCGSNNCPFILDLGDNFYPEGVLSPTDPKFDSSWRNIYNHPALVNLNWYISIGNRDYIDKRPSDGRELHQVTFGRTEPRWILPHLWYDFVVPDPAGFSVHFVIVDSQALRWGANDADEQWAWLENTLATSTSEWKIVMTHHPPYAVGNQGPTDATMEQEVLPIVKRNKVQLWLSGHDHNHQHFRNATFPAEIDYVISGGGGRATNNIDSSKVTNVQGRGIKVEYFGFHNGFIDVDIGAESLTVRYIDENGVNRYQFSRGRSTVNP